MRLVLVLWILAIGATNALPTDTIPKDNSHYVEGQSRYIWMTRDDGGEELVDLEQRLDKEATRAASRNGELNVYWLFTRQNPTTPQIIVHGDSASLTSSHFNPSRLTKVIAHGWTNDGNSPINVRLTAAFLSADDVNVIVLDWGQVASSLYIVAMSTVPSVGEHLGHFLNWLVESTHTPWKNIHLVGHSLGGHVIANAGRATGGMVRILTSLDPAGPGWGVSNENRIRPSDGAYVEVIHTDGGIYGLTAACGDVDFYPNGGRNRQPGCLSSSCSHGRAVGLFEASVYYQHLVGVLCDSLESALVGDCISSTVLELGTIRPDKWGFGIYHLETDSVYPF